MRNSNSNFNFIPDLIHSSSWSTGDPPLIMELTLMMVKQLVPFHISFSVAEIVIYSLSLDNRSMVLDLRN